MQPILAESAPHRGRTVALVTALMVVTALIAVSLRPHPRHQRHGHRELPRIGRCVHSYAYMTR